MYLNNAFILYSMQGKTKCPHCKEKVLVEVPDGSTGEQITQCPNCGVEFKVDIDEKYSWEEKTPIVPPSLHLKPRSFKPMIVGILLLIIFILGIIASTLLVFVYDFTEKANIESTFEGEVVDIHGDPLEGVTVSVLHHPEIANVTNVKGKFSLSNITTGKQTVQFTKEGYKTLQMEVFVLPLNINIEKFVMKEGSGEIAEKSLLIKIFDNAHWVYIPLVIFSVIAAIGGVVALMKKYFILALLGSIFGIIAGFFTLIGIPLGIAALILLLLSKEEFEVKPKEVKY